MAQVSAIQLSWVWLVGYQQQHKNKINKVLLIQTTNTEIDSDIVK